MWLSAPGWEGCRRGHPWQGGGRWGRAPVRWLVLPPLLPDGEAEAHRTQTCSASLVGRRQGSWGHTRQWALVTRGRLLAAVSLGPPHRGPSQDSLFLAVSSSTAPLPGPSVCPQRAFLRGGGSGGRCPRTALGGEGVSQAWGRRWLRASGCPATHRTWLRRRGLLPAELAVVASASVTSCCFSSSRASSPRLVKALTLSRFPGSGVGGGGGGTDAGRRSHLPCRETGSPHAVQI